LEDALGIEIESNTGHGFLVADIVPIGCPRSNIGDIHDAAQILGVLRSVAVVKDRRNFD
jgi:hypothetical protein